MAFSAPIVQGQVAGKGSTSQTSYTSGVTAQPADNAVVLFFVNSDVSAGTGNTPTIPTPWGWGNASLITSITDGGQRRLTALRATGTGATVSTYTVDFGGQQQAGCVATAQAYAGANTGSPIAQSATSFNTGSESHATVLLGSTPAASSAVIGMFGNGGNATFTAGSGYTIVVQLAGGSAPRLLFEDILASGTTTVDCTFTATTWYGIAVELALASSTGGLPYSFKRRQQGDN